MRKSNLLVCGLFFAPFILMCIWFLKEPVPTVKVKPASLNADQPVPNFSSIDSIEDKKNAFFNYLAPVVAIHNQYMLSIREHLNSWKEKVEQGKTLSAFDISELAFLQSEYNVSESQPLEATLDELLMKIDVVPIELALIQAANESAWGTSRFAINGFNFFGQWCFVEGCGFVPNRRIEGAIHEVAKFKSVDAAVYSYIRNLNRHFAYQDMRQIRADLREQGLPITGSKLAEGLMKYSERGAEYVEELQQMIRINQGFIKQ